MREAALQAEGLLFELAQLGERAGHPLCVALLLPRAALRRHLERLRRVLRAPLDLVGRAAAAAAADVGVVGRGGLGVGLAARDAALELLALRQQLGPAELHRVPHPAQLVRPVRHAAQLLLQLEVLVAQPLELALLPGGEADVGELLLLPLGEAREEVVLLVLLVEPLAQLVRDVLQPLRLVELARVRLELLLHLAVLAARARERSVDPSQLGRAALAGRLQD